MIHATLAARMGWRDLRRRTSETLLLLVAIGVAATTLTVGLVLHGQTGAPYSQTRSTTAGPDEIGFVTPPPRRVLPTAKLRRLRALGHLPGVTRRSGPFPETWTSVVAGSVTGVAAVQGRDRAPSAVDRPLVVSGTWVRRSGAVVERAFAQALGVRVGDQLRLGGRTVPVVGIAVSAALPSYPRLCTIGCILDEPGWGEQQPGLVWLTRSDARSYASRREPLVWISYLQLAPSLDAPAFAAAHAVSSPLGPTLTPWQEVARRHAETLSNERAVALFGSSLLVVLALATVVVLVGGRMADEVRRVGTLKALGATPGFVVRTLLTTYVAIGVVASGLGLAAGRLVAPLLVAPSGGLLGREGDTTVTAADVGTVLGTMVLIVVLASLLPAWRAARTSTVHALADAGRRPRRSRILIRLSAELPTPALLGLRLAARRPRRAALTATSIAVAVAGAMVVICAQQSLRAESGGAGGPADPDATQLRAVMLALTVLLAVMAAVNLLFVTRATAADARGALAVARALGASPAQSSVGLAVAQALPAALGLVTGIPSGILLYHALAVSHPVMPSAGIVLGVAVGTMLAVGLLTAIPARVEARRPIAALLREV